MKLLSSPSSPFVRKVKIAAGMKGVLSKIEQRPTDTIAGDDMLFGQNPLGKIPTLTTDSGDVLYDSPVICEYLDTLAPEPVLFPKSGAERFRTLTLGSLGDGILDAALLLVYERLFSK
jgi:glutathione S-transferase